MGYKKVYVVIDRVDGEIDGIYMNESDANEHCAAFNNADNYYDMEVEEWEVESQYKESDHV